MLRAAEGTVLVTLAGEDGDDLLSNEAADSALLIGGGGGIAADLSRRPSGGLLTPSASVQDLVGGRRVAMG